MLWFNLMSDVIVILTIAPVSILLGLLPIRATILMFELSFIRDFTFTRKPGISTRVIPCVKFSLSNGELALSDDVQPVNQVIFVSHKWFDDDPVPLLVENKIKEYLMSSVTKTAFFWVDYLCVNQESGSLFDEITNVMVLTPYFKDFIIVEMNLFLYQSSAWCYFERSLRGMNEPPVFLSLRNEIDKKLMLNFVRKVITEVDYHESTKSLKWYGGHISYMCMSIVNLQKNSLNSSSDVRRGFSHLFKNESTLLTLLRHFCGLMSVIILFLCLGSCLNIKDFINLFISFTSRKYLLVDVKVICLEPFLRYSSRYSFQPANQILVALDDLDHTNELKSGNFVSHMSLSNINSYSKDEGVFIINNLNLFKKVVSKGGDLGLELLIKVFTGKEGWLAHDPGEISIVWPFENFSIDDLNESVGLQYYASNLSSSYSDKKAILRRLKVTTNDTMSIPTNNIF